MKFTLLTYSMIFLSCILTVHGYSATITSVEIDNSHNGFKVRKNIANFPVRRDVLDSVAPSGHHFSPAKMQSPYKEQNFQGKSWSSHSQANGRWKRPDCSLNEGVTMNRVLEEGE